jgi:Leucine-rich repeat (LRR) protein
MTKKVEEDFLESLSKYETFNDITHLDISHKKLRKIKILPKNLVILNCSHNNLKKLFDEDCVIPETLIKIDCSHNKLQSINQIQKLPNLKILDCSHNLIRKIDYPINIEEINMDNNLISGKINFKEGLKILSANNNLITSFDYEEIPSELNKIYLKNNKIEIFPYIKGLFDSSIIMDLRNNPIIKNDSAGKNLYNIILRDKPKNYEFKLKFNIE